MRRAGRAFGVARLEISDVAARVARHVDHGEVERGRVQMDGVAALHARHIRVERPERLAGRSVDRHAAIGKQVCHTADMVVVVMGE